MASLNISDFISVMRKSDELNDRNFVRKENGKSLSTNDYSNEDKAKLASIDVEEIAGKTYMQELINGAITDINSNINTKITALSASVGEKLDELGGTLNVTYDNDTNILQWSDSQNLYSQVFLNGNCVYSGNDTSFRLTPVGGDNVIDVVAFDKLRKEVKQGSIIVSLTEEATLTIELEEGQTIEDVQFDGESVEYTDGMTIPTTVEKIYIQVSKIKVYEFRNDSSKTRYYLDFEYTFDNEIGKHFKIKPYNKDAYYINSNSNIKYSSYATTSLTTFYYIYNSVNMADMYIRIPYSNNSGISYLNEASSIWDLDTNTSSYSVIGSNSLPINIDIIHSEKMCLKSLLMYSAANIDAPKKFDIQGSDDDINWVTIASDCTFEGYTTPEQQYIELPNNKSFYKKHRIIIKEIFNPNSYTIRLRMFRFTMLKEGSVI